MDLALGLGMLWVGCVLMYVAIHGVSGSGKGFMAIWEEALRDIAAGA